MNQNANQKSCTPVGKESYNTSLILKKAPSMEFIDRRKCQLCLYNRFNLKNTICVHKKIDVFSSNHQELQSSSSDKIIPEKSYSRWKQKVSPNISSNHPRYFEDTHQSEANRNNSCSNESKNQQQFTITTLSKKIRVGTAQNATGENHRDCGIFVTVRDWIVRAAPNQTRESSDSKKPSNELLLDSKGTTEYTMIPSNKENASNTEKDAENATEPIYAVINKQSKQKNQQKPTSRQQTSISMNFDQYYENVDCIRKPEQQLSNDSTGSEGYLEDSVSHKTDNLNNNSSTGNGIPVYAEIQKKMKAKK